MITVGIGLFIVGLGKPSILKVLIARPVTGVCVAFMHYTGMAAMQINGSFDYNERPLLRVLAIAVVAATVALWFTVVSPRHPRHVAAAAVMGVAVCSMHYTGMAAMHVTITTDNLATVPGVDVNWFLAPIVLFVLVVVIALASAVMAVPSEREQAEAAAIRDKIAAGDALRTATAGPVFGGGPANTPAAPGTGQAFSARAANGIADARRQRGR